MVIIDYPNTCKRVNMKNKNILSLLFDMSNYLFLAVFSISVIFPFYYIIVQSLINPDSVSTVTAMSKIIFPRSLNFRMYEYVLTSPKVLIGYRNTIMYTVLGTMMGFIVVVMASYAMSKKNLGFRNLITIFFLIPMFISGGLIPTFLLIKELGLYNTIFAIILPGAFSPYIMVLVRTNFQQMPKELEESAVIEGANSFYILLKIYLPLSKAILAYLVLMYVVSSWNSWFNVLIYIKDPNLHTIQVVLRNLISSNEFDNYSRWAQIFNDTTNSFVYLESFKYTLMVVVFLPIIIFYPFLQKYFIKGIMIGSLKG